MPTSRKITVLVGLLLASALLGAFVYASPKRPAQPKAKAGLKIPGRYVKALRTVLDDRVHDEALEPEDQVLENFDVTIWESKDQIQISVDPHIDRLAEPTLGGGVTYSVNAKTFLI